MFKDLLFPSLCVVCNKYKGLVCTECSRVYFDNLELQICKPENSKLKYHLYLADYGPIYRKFIHHGKYKFNKRVWVKIGQILKSKLSPKSKSFVTYVPLHWRRYCYRGFNQAELIAKEIGRPKKALKRIVHATSFTGLLEDQRRLKARSLFQALNVDYREYHSCYLVDDVVTTGATMEACAELIKERNPHLDVIGISFAKTPKHSEFMLT